MRPISTQQLFCYLGHLVHQILSSQALSPLHPTQVPRDCMSQCSICLLRCPSGPRRNCQTRVTHSLMSCRPISGSPIHFSWMFSSCEIRPSCQNDRPDPNRVLAVIVITSPTTSASSRCTKKTIPTNTFSGTTDKTPLIDSCPNSSELWCLEGNYPHSCSIFQSLGDRSLELQKC